MRQRGHTEEEYIKKAWCHEIGLDRPKSMRLCQNHSKPSKPVRTDLMITILEEIFPKIPGSYTPKNAVGINPKILRMNPPKFLEMLDYQNLE